MRFASKDLFKASRAASLTTIVCIALAQFALAKAGAGPKSAPAAPTSGGAHAGQYQITNSKDQSGHTPQSLVPIGTAEEPRRPQFDLSKLMQAVRLSLVTMDTPAAASTPEAQAVRAAIQRRDARLASKNLPRRVEVVSQ